MLTQEKKIQPKVNTASLDPKKTSVYAGGEGIQKLNEVKILFVVYINRVYCS